MNIGIIDADLIDGGTRHPNLALMKISSWFKNRGHRIKLLENYDNLDEWDRVYISKVFDYTSSPDSILSKDNIVIGGTGFFKDGGVNLPSDVEHAKPDYSLYNDFIEKQIDNGRPKSYFKDYLDYSIGFTTRGCFRKCDFCVNKKYDRVFKHSPVSEFLDDSRKYIYLWDDNFLGYPGWEEVLDELDATEKRYQFRQGLDIRLMTERKAKRLSKAKYKGDFIFAFDFIEDKKLIQQKLKIWRKYNKKNTKLYVLTGYGSQDHKDIQNTFERIKTLMEFGCLPYIMRYEKYKESPYKGMYIQLARWCNQPSLFKKKSFRQYCELNQKTIKTPGFKSAPIRAMEKFENNHPEIADKYFDLRFEDLNKYS